ncbi:MAG: NADAR family protein [Candidatus Paceibacterota bacterium]
MNKSSTIYFYGGGYNCLSNFAAYQVVYDDRIWMTAEHAYQAHKFNDTDIQDEIQSCASAHAAKQLAHEYGNHVREDWFDINVEIMENILRAKLSKHQHIQQKLRVSAEKELVEDSDDEFWGCGENRNGKNMLGKLWIKLRNELLKT